MIHRNLFLCNDMPLCLQVLSFLCFPLSFAPFVCSRCQFNDCLGLDLFLASLTRSFRCFVSSLLKFDVLVLKCDYYLAVIVLVFMFSQLPYVLVGTDFASIYAILLCYIASSLVVAPPGVYRVIITCMLLCARLCLE